MALAGKQQTELTAEQIVQYRTAGDVRISIHELTQPEGSTATEAMPGWIMDGSERVVVLSKTNKAVWRVMFDARVMTCDSGLGRSGPCWVNEETGVRTSWGKNKKWETLSGDEFYALMHEFRNLMRTDSIQGYETAGQGPVRVAGDYSDSTLYFSADKYVEYRYQHYPQEATRGYVIWEREEPEAAADVNTELSALLRELLPGLEKKFEWSLSVEGAATFESLKKLERMILEQ